MLGAAAYAVSPSLFIWMLPVTVGLLLSIPLAALTSSTDIGLALRRLHLLVIPEERRPPQVLVRANELAVCLRNDDVNVYELLQRHDLRIAHAEMLGPQPKRERGDIDSDLAIAKAKAEDAATLSEAIGFFTPAEMRALLSDPKGYQALLAKRPVPAVR
jgi:membrane glycosyltransferase